MRAHAHSRRSSLLCAAALTAFLSPCHRPVLAQPVLAPPAPAPLTATAPQLSLAQLVELTATRLDVRLEFDPQALQGAVALALPDALRDDELWALTNQALAQRGFTTIRLPGSVAFSVVPLASAAKLAAVEVTSQAPPSTAAPQPWFSSRALPTPPGSTRAALDALAPLLSQPGGAAAALGESGLIVISDFTAKLPQAQAVLDSLRTIKHADAQPAPKSSLVALIDIPVQHAGPAAVATLATQLAAKQHAAGGDKLPGELLPSTTTAAVTIIAPQRAEDAWRALIARADQPQAVESRDYRPRAFAPDQVASLIEQVLSAQPSKGPPHSLVVDSLTGTLILTASATTHAVVEQLLQRLDDTQSGPRPMRSFPIRNRPVADILSTLRALISAGALDASPDANQAPSSPSRPAPSSAQTTLRDIRDPASAPLLPASPNARPEPAPLEVDAALRLTADEATNSLIAIGEARLLNQLDALLAMLDVRQPQVMIDVVLVSLTDTQAKNLGIEIERLGSVGDASYKLSSLFGLSSAGQGARSVADAAGFTGAVLNPGEFSVVVRALQAVNLGRSVSNPKLLVSNNEQARFSSVLSQPFVRTDTTNSTATSSFGGSDSAGTTISVRPQIAQANHLVLSYSISLSSFIGTPAAAGLPPPKQQNNVDSVATIPDGHVIAIGGLDLESDSQSTSQVPILGDIPLLGEAFKSRATGKSRTRFFAFIRAQVLRESTAAQGDLRALSDDLATRMDVPSFRPTPEPEFLPAPATEAP